MKGKSRDTDQLLRKFILIFLPLSLFSYLPAMSKRIDIFSPNSIRLIFSNIQAIYKFQKRFLDALRKGIEQNQISKVFLKMVSPEFKPKLYSY